MTERRTILDTLKADYEMYRKRARLYAYLASDMDQAADHCEELITELELEEVAGLPTTTEPPVEA